MSDHLLVICVLFWQHLSSPSTLYHIFPTPATVRCSVKGRVNHNIHVLLMVSAKLEEACKVSSWTSPVEKDHGRIEKRTITVASANWFENMGLWAGLDCFVRVCRTVTTNGKNTDFERFYISSLHKTPEEFCTLIRGHWSIENQLHWCLDVVFGEDASCARKDNSPLNLNVLRKTALRLLKQCDLGKRVSMKKKRYMAALNVSTLKMVICGE